MLCLLALLGTGLHDAAAVTHSLNYSYTASSGLNDPPNFPEFVFVSFVDGVQAFRYDSDTMKAKPRRPWMISARHRADLWTHQTDLVKEAQQDFRTYLDITKQRVNHTAGVHVLQWTYSCEWDDETNQATCFDKWLYDGEAYKPYEPMMEALNDPPNPQYVNYVWLKVILDHKRWSLLRTAPPSVSLLQKTPSSPVSCHATGFYPDRADLFWRKDGVEFHEEVDRGEILPNRNGTFRMSVDLNLSSVTPEDWTRYDCVFQFSGLKEDIVTKLEKDQIRTNWAGSSPEVKQTNLNTLHG